MIKHMIKKGKVNHQSKPLINWREIECARKSLPQHRQTWLTKHISGYNATGRQMLRRKEWENSRCPKCNEEHENSDHVVTCPCNDAREKFDDMILDLCQKMERIKTCPVITEIITMTLFDGKDGSLSAQAVESQHEMNDAYYQVLQKSTAEQDIIGWTNMLEGEINK